MFVKRLTIKYEGTTDIPTQLANNDIDTVFDYIEFILRRSNNIEHIGVDIARTH